MRVLVCDDHVLFADSLAHLLRARGRDVVAVAHEPAAAVAALRRTPADIAVLDVSYGGDDTVLNHLTELHRVAPATRVVLLCGQIDNDLLAACRIAGVHAVADKRQPADEIMTILDRVYQGERLIPADTGTAEAEPAVPAARAPAGDAQWLAGFLTPREREVLSALVRGNGTAKLARTLGIAEATARCHVQAVLTKMGAHSRLEAATTAVRHGMVNPETGEWLVRGPHGGAR